MSIPSNRDTSSSTLTMTIDWSGVRPIYKKLGKEFHVLTNAFEIKIDQSTKHRLDHLITTIDCVDRIIDDLPGQRKRDGLCSAMIDFLEKDNQRIQDENATPELNSRLRSVRNIVNELNVKKHFISVAKVIFEYTEKKRHEKNINDFLGFVQIEGETTADLPLAFLGNKGNDRFKSFFRKLCRIMGIADLLLDAVPDYRKNRIVIKPSVLLYVKLLRILISDGFKIIRLFPNKLKLLKYAAKFVAALIKGE